MLELKYQMSPGSLLLPCCLLKAYFYHDARVVQFWMCHRRPCLSPSSEQCQYMVNYLHHV